GTVYKIDPSGNETTLVEFNATTNGFTPTGSLLLVGNTLYGTVEGVLPSSYGAVFSVNTDGSNFQLLHLFNSNNAFEPIGPQLLAPGGKAIYGITEYGGRGAHQGSGVVYQLNLNGAFAILHAFKKTDGITPDMLLMNAAGTLYGSTSSGGTNNQGTVFSLVPSTRAFATLYSFTGKKDEGIPTLGSIGPGGVLYGATYGAIFANPPQYGTLFSLTPNGSTYRYTELHKFGVGGNVTYGANPGPPQILADGGLVGSDFEGLYLYDPSVPYGGISFNPQSVVPNFEGGRAVTLFSNAVYGEAVGGNVSTQYPYGAGVIFRWSPGTQ
ncbi:MAG: hypothetical protein POG24_05060, partial [Acidocella sp.]|nr:hypothetical protein [Acidocella sp.]